MSKARILVVDDMPPNLMLLSGMLEPEGYDVQTATSGIDALGAVARQQFDLVILDVIMPGLDGFDTCRKIKQRLGTEEYLPVVMVTALDSREDKLHALEVGADDFLSKPVDRLELLARVRNLCRLSVLHRGMASYNNDVRRQLDMASEVQLAILGRNNCDLNSMQIRAAYHPEGAIGGDLYDVVPLPGGRVGVFIADVAGHGVPAALLTGVVKSFFTELAREQKDPAQLLAVLNQRLLPICNRSQGMYVTAIYGIIDPGLNWIDLAGAGHPEPLLLRKGSVEGINVKGGFLGVTCPQQFDKTGVKLEQGDLLLLYTDGLLDLYGSPRKFYADAARLCSTYGVDMFYRKIEEKVKKEVHGDDVALFSVYVK